MDQEILQALNEIRTELREIKGYVLELFKTFSLGI
jgi:hypothetical protein